MIGLDLPAYACRETYELCISKVRSEADKNRMQLAALAIETACGEYEQHATNETLHELVSENTVAGVTSEEMKATYNSRMVKVGSPGREIYEAIMSAPREGRCPYCGERVVSTLDHVLPKSLYPAFAVAPINLVPSCGDCNKLKLDDDPNDATEVFIHPYYDFVDDCSWLSAEVVEENPTALIFSVEACDDWGHVKQERVVRQFNRLKLGRLYALQAATELTAIQYHLSMVLGLGGPDVVRDYLTEQAVSARHARRNWWRAVAYESWAASNWFCQGGFQ